MIRILLNSFFALLLSISAFSQHRQYVFTRISNKEGLASNYVYSIMQDRKGFMWFGTANGLQRYDGKKVIMFRTPETEGDYLPSVPISQIFEDKQGNFWLRSGKDIGIFDPATFRFNRSKLLVDPGVPTRSDYQLWEDSDGNVFLIVKRHGYYSFDKATNTFSRSKNPFALPSNWKPTQIIEEPGNKQYWIVTDSGLAIYNKITKQVYSRLNNPDRIELLSDPNLNHNITAFYLDRTRKAWIVTWPSGYTGERFHCFDLNKNTLVPEVFGLSESTMRYHELYSFFEQRNGTLWAYGRMLFLERDSVQKRFHYIRDEHLDDYGLKYDMVHSMFEDRENNIWVGTNEGVYIFNPGAQRFNSVDLESYDSTGDGDERTVTSFLETRNKEIWVGSWGKGVLSYDSNFRALPRRILKATGKTEYNLVWSLCEESRTGRVWVGCQAGKVMVYDPANKKTEYLEPKLFETKTIRQVIEDRKGNIWLGSQYGHLVKWDPRRGATNIMDGFSLVRNLNTIIYKLFIDKEGYLWAATHVYGTYKIDPETGAILANYNSQGGKGKSIFNDVASDIVQYNDSLFVIVSGVLNVLNTRTQEIEFINHAKGLPSHTVSSVSIDNQGNLWVGSLSGLSRYNFRKKIFTTFNPRDGVLNNDFYTAASLKTRSGMLLFGTSKDYVYFKPEQITTLSAPPDVSITDFKLFNSYLPPDSIMKLDRVRLDHTQNSITIEFAALSFLQKDKIVYYYKLQGIDEDWVRAENPLVANYPLLPPGHYSFKVYCENGEGVSSENITQLHIYVQPPFYRTWWFLALILMAIGGLIYLAHRLRVNRILSMEKVRTRIARDLHDDMGSTLSTINILSEMAKMKVEKDSNKTAEYLNKISDNSSRMMEAMDDIVWSINPANDNMQRITARMREFATGVLEAKNIDFTFRVDEEVKDLKLDMEARRDFFLLFKEAVNNLAKYSDCRHASIDISVNRSKLFMKILDDGVGFDVANADSGNGLTNMRKRAQTLGGILLINSNINEGTQVLLEVNVT